MEVLDSSRQFELLSSKDMGFASTKAHKVAYQPSILEKHAMSITPMTSNLSDSFHMPLKQASESLNVPSPTSSTNKKVTKQPTKTRRRWKRPKDKPKRPLSAYNLYFKAERERIISGQVPDCSKNLGFRAMAQFVAKKWNTLDGGERSTYEESAMKEKSKYFTALAQWKRTKKEEEAKKASEELKEQKSAPVPSGIKQSRSKAQANLPKKKKAALPDRAISKPLSDITEPLPIEYHVGLTSDLGVILSDGDKQNDSLIDTLQKTLGCHPEDSSQRYGNTMPVNQGYPDDPSSLIPVMKRVLATFDTLHADNDFIDFMSTLDWR